MSLPILESKTINVVPVRRHSLRLVLEEDVEITHTSVKNHKCVTCQKIFSQASSLRTHELTHNGVKY